MQVAEFGSRAAVIAYALMQSFAQTPTRTSPPSSPSVPPVPAASPGTSPAAAPAVPREISARIVGAALLERGALHFARGLAEGVGARLTGSKQAERAVVFAEDAMKRAGLSNVRREPLQTRSWQRGPIAAILRADAKVVGSVDQPLAVLALGGTVATPADGIEADVIEVRSLAEIGALGERGKGAIVFFNHTMQRSTDTNEYGAVSSVRYKGPPEAARVGAAAFLMRSAGTGAHRLPHTGITQPGATVPAAALAAEDADLLARRLAAGKVRVHLRLEARDLGKTSSANVVGELPGGARKDEIVLVGAHLDSWDVGQGALDDAAGVGIVLDTARILAGIRPAVARTVRVVLFMGEEVDASGANAYATAHKAELGRHVAALEADSGDGRPLRYGVTSAERDLPLLRRWISPTTALLPSEVRLVEDGGADMGPLQKAGVPILDVAQDHGKYFEWHHTAGDTSDKLDGHDLALATAAYAHLTYVLATAPEVLSRSTP